MAFIAAFAIAFNYEKVENKCRNEEKIESLRIELKNLRDDKNKITN